MGACRIKIVISKSLFETQSRDNENDSTRRETTLSSAEVYSSDTTVRELIERHVDLWKIVSSDNNNNNNNHDSDATLWDCTLNPPKDITSWPFVEYPDLQGPKSLTLHRAGWFPSATLVCLPVGVSPIGYNNSVSGDDPYADVQYNKTQHIFSGGDTQTGGSVQFKDQSLDKTSKPSEVMASVSRRFDDEDEAIKARRKTEQDNKSQQRTKYLEQKNRQRERAAKLDQKIAALEELEDKGSKKKKGKDGVSAQVLRMLVKSRATGDDRLKIQDRLYFQCLLLHPDGVDDDENGGTTSVSSSKEYRYFSPQDTFARIAGSFDLDKNKIPNSSTLLTEVLCRIPPPSKTNVDSDYRRFPMTMRVYEAISQGFLNDQIDTLIVRCFKDRDGATALSVNDADEEVETFQDLDEEDSKIDTNQDNGENVRQTEPTESLDVPMTDSTSSFQDLKLSETIQGLGSDGKKGSAKKAKSSSAAAIKVRQMKMKSTASGDSKRVKMDDRFYLDIVTVDNDGEDGNYRASSGYYFLSRKDPLERIIQYLDKNNLKSKSIIDWDLLLVSEGENGTSSFRRIPDTSRTMDELEADGDLNIKPFDRLILKYIS